MLLQTVLYLTSVVSAIALIALILVLDRPDSDRSPAPGLARAIRWSTGLFLTSALLIALADLRTTGSVLDFVESPRGAAVEAAAAPSATARTVASELSVIGVGTATR